MTMRIPRRKHMAETEEMRTVRMAAETAEREDKNPGRALYYRKLYRKLQDEAARRL